MNPRLSRILPRAHFNDLIYLDCHQQWSSVTNGTTQAQRNGRLASGTERATSEAQTSTNPGSGLSSGTGWGQNRVEERGMHSHTVNYPLWATIPSQQISTSEAEMAVGSSSWPVRSQQGQGQRILNGAMAGSPPAELTTQPMPEIPSRAWSPEQPWTLRPRSTLRTQQPFSPVEPVRAESAQAPTHAQQGAHAQQCSVQPMPEPAQSAVNEGQHPAQLAQSSVQARQQNQISARQHQWTGADIDVPVQYLPTSWASWWQQAMEDWGRQDAQLGGAEHLMVQPAAPEQSAEDMTRAAARLAQRPMQSMQPTVSGQQPMQMLGQPVLPQYEPPHQSLQPTVSTAQPSVYLSQAATEPPTAGV